MGCDGLQITVKASACGFELGHDFRILEAALYANQYRSTAGSECNSSGLDHHPDHHSSQGWKIQSYHKRSGNGCRSAKSGGSFNERTEQPGDDHHLDPSVRTVKAKTMGIAFFAKRTNYRFLFLFFLIKEEAAMLAILLRRETTEPLSSGCTLFVRRMT